MFEIIVSDLSLDAFLALRIASRLINHLSFSSFAQKYFSKLNTTLGSASLDRLVHISKHDYLSQAVTVLDIRLLAHRDYKLLKQISRLGKFPVPKRFPKLSGVRPEDSTQEATLYDDVLKSEFPRFIIDRLSFSLRAFSKLKSIRFRTCHTEPHGWRSTTMPEGDQLFRSKCFYAVVNAIIKSEVTLEEFSMARGKRLTTLSRCANLIYPTLALPFASFNALQFSFANLKSLTLSIITAHNGNARVPGWENGISSVIATAPSLENLALSLDRDCSISHYSAAVIHSLALSCRIPNLQIFQLVNSSLHEGDLVSFMKEHTEKLSQIILSDIRLLTGSWTSLWTSFQSFHNLQCLRLASLEGTQNPVLFRRRNKERLKITLDSQKAERSMTSMLDDLINACSYTTIDLA